MFIKLIKKSNKIVIKFKYCFFQISFSTYVNRIYAHMNMLLIIDIYFKKIGKREINARI